MGKITLNISNAKYIKALEYHKEILSDQIKSVQMVDGIIIFDLQRTFWETLYFAVKKWFSITNGSKSVL